MTTIAEQRRIDGLEIRTIFDANPTLESDIAFLKKLAIDNNLLTTVGVDAHEPDDFKDFVAIPGAAEMSVGQWAKVASHQF